MNLYIIRHGETTRKKSKKIKGHEDVPLSDVWINQALHIADFFEKKHVDDIWSSDLIRCKDSIKPFAQRRWIHVTLSDLIKEKHFWDFQWVSTVWREEEDWQKVHIHESVETRKSLFERVRRFYNEVLVEKTEDQTLVVVTHSWPLMILYALMFWKEEAYLDGTFHMFVWNGAISYFEREDWCWKEIFIDKRCC